ncbi:MAG: addiction module protein [Marinospirillum sp.]|uniref:addiction module protein n=1 Tax=Marinospirillum sp. TaxID=2183934 RepID=UPI0019DCFF94|nr:addiction module protein [Marinospirillum sp.]MBE0507949.1 addiction module protein [Marinospirillum sp.]
MSSLQQTLTAKALELPARERIQMVEQLLSSLDKPDAEMDKIWSHEAEARIDAYERGELAAVSVQEVLGKYKSR